jgi:tRNA threonylcarbamoyladenosine biosynthesis protein TsaB
LPLILNIDTATENASVCLSNNGVVLAFAESTEQKNHAAFLQIAIEQIAANTQITLSQIDAIAATNGPGSYTGLRVGLSSAKGLCYALQKPLILLNTLEVIATKIIATVNSSSTFKESTFLVCPMIDARRMEVFTALYDSDLNIIKEPTSLILSEESFKSELSNNLIVLGGSGSNKLEQIVYQQNAKFIDISYSAVDMISLSEYSFAMGQFANLAYSEPYYLKEFYVPPPKNNYK